MRIGIFALMMLPLLHAETPTQPAAVSEMDRAVEKFRTQTGERGWRTDSPKAVRRGPSAMDYHGRIYWNVRNNAFDAVPHEVTQTGGDQGILRRNQYGFSVSGPVWFPGLVRGTKRTFFTVSYEGVRESEGVSFLETIATRAERGGDFSQTVDKAGVLLPIYDPNSTRPNPAFDPLLDVSAVNLQYLRDVFPGNRVPAARLDPVAVDAVGYYPEPNTAIGPYFQNNFTNYTPERNEADGFRAKIEHNARGRHRFSFGFGLSDGLQGPAKVFDTIANPSGRDRRYRNRQARLDHSFTISPNSVNSLRVSARSRIRETDAVDGTAPFPQYDFAPYLEMGRPFPASWSTNSEFEIEEGVSFRRGRHSIEVGAQIQWEPDSDYEPQYPAGSFQFSEGLTSLPGIVNTGHSFATFLLGEAANAEGSLVGQPSYWRQLQWGTEVTDEWQVKPGLTISFGIDFEVSRPRVEKYDRQSTVDLTAINPENGRPGALVFANQDGYGRAFQSTRLILDPYVGVAWSPFNNSKTVVRASFERESRGFSIPGSHWGTQGFNGTPTYITQNEQLEPAVILRDGLPAPPIPPPDLRPEAANDTDAYLVDVSGRVPTSHSYQVSVERQLAPSLVLGVEAEYRHGWNQNSSDRGTRPNAISLDALGYRDLLNDDAFNRSLRPYPQYRTFNLSYQDGSYRSTGFDVSLEKRTSEGLSLRFSYEYSRRMDNYRARDGLQDYYDRDNEWALAYYNEPHELSLRYMYEIPFGPGKRYLSAAGWKSVLLAGWAISGITSYSSGNPIGLLAQFNNTGGVVSALYVNAVPGVDPRVENQGPELWFNPEAFVNPADFSIGNVSRSHPTLRNPSRQNHDLAVSKRFRLSSDQEIEFVGTALNFLNHANWNEPDNEIGPLGSPNTNAGRIIGSRGGRVIQLGLRLSF